MIDLKYLSDLNQAAFNTCENRSWYKPYSSLNSLKNNVDDNMLNLDGEWQFAYFDDIRKALDFPFIQFNDRVKLPHCAQLDGYDFPVYCGGSYIMPYFPPHVPYNNPAFAYKKNVKINKSGRHFILFEGVDSCFYLYINKRFVGFARVSHSFNEFEITDYINDGENEICLLVAKFNVGSYLEDQDKWRLSGIFSSVFILTRPQKFLLDYTVKTNIENQPCAEFIFNNPQNVEISVTFDGKTYFATDNCLNTITISVPNAKLWSAEQPYLYDFLIKAGEEYICERVGFRKIEVQNGVVKVNGKAVKFYGVNRHEFHPERGAAITEEDIINDLRLMKKLNVNAIRTSHYPNRHRFYELCDEYGFYVIDEADLECHGAAHQNGVNTYEEKLFSDLAENPAWECEFLYRINKLYSRDKNRCCVLFWSLGNESGYGQNFEKSAKWLKERGDGRLIHYEGVFHRPAEDIYYTEKLDVMSRMYPELSWMKQDYLNDEREKRPLVLCEYSHAMGNSNGDLKDYWDIIENNERFCGAFVWEWADHGINTGDGKLKYGGDFGEIKHTGKFCMDGLVSSYRQIKSGALEMKHVYSPVTIEKTGKNEYLVFNKNYFKNIDDLILQYQIKSEGVVLKAGKLPLDGIMPRSQKKFTLTCESLKGFSNIVFNIIHKTDNMFFEREEPVYTKAFTLKEYEYLPLADIAVIKSDLNDSPFFTQVNTGDYTYIFKKDSGVLQSINKQGFSILEDALTVNIARARLDNDSSIFANWESIGIYKVAPYAFSQRVEKMNNGAVKLSFDCALLCESTKPHVTYSIDYVMENNRLTVNLHAKVSDFVKYLPRFGLTFALSDSYSKIDYLGLSGESYPDKRNYAYKDVCSFDVSKDYPDYTVPQECGSREDTDWVVISNSRGEKIKMQSNKPFCFSALPYSTMQLNNAAHNWQLEKSGKTYICADYKTSGVGSNSCGPELDEKYRLSEKDIAFKLILEALEK